MSSWLGSSTRTGLQPAFQRRVPLHVLAVVVQGGGADALHLAPGQRRLQYVGSVHRPFGGPGADDGVNLVDEEDAVAGRLDLFDYLLKAFFELAPVLGAGDQRAHVQGDQPLALQGIRNVPLADALGQRLDDGRLAHSGLAHQHRVVLGAAAEDLDHPLDFLLPSDDRVQLIGLGGHGKVDSQLV